MDRRSFRGIGGLLAAGFRLVGKNDTEGTTTSTSAADVVTVGGLSISVNTPIIIVASLRKSTGTAAIANVGLKLNATEVRSPNAWCDSSASVRLGTFWAFIGSHDGTYTKPGFTIKGGDGVGPALHLVSAAIPNATITDVIITGSVGNADNTMGVKYVKVYTLPGG